MSSDPGPSRPASPRPPTGPKPATPRPATPRKGHLPIGEGFSLAQILAGAAKLTTQLIDVLAAQRTDPNADMPGEVDRALGGMVAELRLMHAELADLSDAARQGLPARGPGGPSDQGPLPGRTVTAGSAAAGGSAQGLGRSTGAGSKPGRSPGRAEDVAAPVAHPGGSPETAAAVLGAGAPIRHADGSFSLPVWPGTERLARSISAFVAAATRPPPKPPSVPSRPPARPKLAK